MDPQWDDSQPIYRQLRDLVVAMILDGVLKEGDALPGEATANDLERLTLAVYSRGAEIARERGVIIADTKFEFGRDASGRLILADEVLTPDSSRFWKLSQYQPGRQQWSYDKQYLRDWSSSLGDWNRTYPGPPVPPDVVRETRSRYVEIYEQLSGEKWSS